MTQDLDVQTPLIRQAAGILDDAARAFAGDVGDVGLHCPLTNDSLGPSAVAREVVDAAARRVQQAVGAAKHLEVLATDTAGKLRTSAIAFEAAESNAITGPR